MAKPPAPSSCLPNPSWRRLVKKIEDWVFKGQGKGKGREVRSTSASNDAPQSQADFKQMDFEEAKAFFYDMQVAEMKSQGKGLGP
ncbi:hypothetical protein HYDPIDRAFT_34137 [Hydnomerulius pinastri MD-312]|uniref:Uncharacterized protein n=1 Tax=Hydnomerulius pinastri MD-312 TaxID=994086 RepID=A0A0C9VYK5_9AGAM|nr:hypothetical protein HYDPIDRAFT_34137 [Hydnomerulius pinastri MD-312]